MRGQKIGNYITNGNFEECINCTITPYYAMPRGWTALDSSDWAFIPFSLSPPLSNLPYGFGFQYPRSGNTLIGTGFYCGSNSCTSYNQRGYPRNRLKEKLKVNTIYCAKYYVNNRNTNTIGIDGFGMYFGDASLDTINYCGYPLIYLVPQVQNPSNNIILDTLNWTAISGTFVATGNEKYAVLGNFKSNASTNTVILNPLFLPQVGTDILIEDVSLIEANLQAYAGPDYIILPGDSAFIGRQPDWAIDPGCIWYKLPNMITSIDTISGFWVKPTTTSTYVVKQQLDCSSLKWDTVVVTINNNLVGIDKLQWFSDNISIFPNPTSGNLNISFPSQTDIKTYIISNSLGQIIREEEIEIKNSTCNVSTSDLKNGLYQIHFKIQFGILTKKFVKTN